MEKQQRSKKHTINSLADIITDMPTAPLVPVSINIEKKVFPPFEKVDTLPEIFS
jgi:hypothetical protein